MTKQRRTINVSKADIAEGCRTVADSCPVARAMTRTLRRSVRVCGGTYGWRFPDEGYGARLLPPKADKFIGDFDSGGEVQPFGFTLIYEA